MMLTRGDIWLRYRGRSLASRAERTDANHSVAAGESWFVRTVRRAAEKEEGWEAIEMGSMGWDGVGRGRLR